MQPRNYGAEPAFSAEAHVRCPRGEMKPKLRLRPRWTVLGKGTEDAWVPRGQEAKQDDAEHRAGQQPRFLLSPSDFTSLVLRTPSSAQDPLPSLPAGASQQAAHGTGSVLTPVWASP